MILPASYLNTTAGTPADCSTENADEELVEVSFAGIAAAAVIAADTEPLGGGCVVTLVLSLPQPVPASTRAAAPNHAIKRFIDDSITSSALLCAAFAFRLCA